MQDQLSADPPTGLSPFPENVTQGHISPPLNGVRDAPEALGMGHVAAEPSILTQSQMGHTVVFTLRSSCTCDVGLNVPIWQEKSFTLGGHMICPRSLLARGRAGTPGPASVTPKSHFFLYSLLPSVLPTVCKIGTRPQMCGYTHQHARMPTHTHAPAHTQSLLPLLVLVTCVPGGRDRRCSY